MFEDLFRHAINPLAVRAMGAAHAAEGPMPDRVELRPPSTRYGFTHVNVVIPELPDPHRFLACMVIAGKPNMKVFRGGGADTARVTTGTAVNPDDGYAEFALGTECALAEDGSALRFGDVLDISGTFPEYAVAIRSGGLSVGIGLECTDQITWFARGPIYDHFGFPARYAGTVIWEGEATQIEGVASLEYARGTPPPVEFPWDFFTYHVLHLAPDTLLMLTQVGAGGAPMLATAYLRQPGGAEGRWVSGVEYEALTVDDEERVSPTGARTRVASAFRWTWPDGEVEVVADTPLHPGLGPGWIGGTAYSGTVGGRAVSGRGYFEYGDQR